MKFIRMSTKKIPYPYVTVAYVPLPKPYFQRMWPLWYKWSLQVRSGSFLMRVGELATHRPNQFLGQMQHDPPGLHPDSKPEPCLPFTCHSSRRIEGKHRTARCLIFVTSNSIPSPNNKQMLKSEQAEESGSKREREKKRHLPLPEKRLELTWHLFLSSTRFPATFLPAMEEACDIGQGGGVQYREPPMSSNPTTAQTIIWTEITAMFFFFNKKKMAN